MGKWRGGLEVFISVEADTEEEAEKKMIDQLILDLKSGNNSFIVWEDDLVQRRDK